MQLLSFIVELIIFSLYKGKRVVFLLQKNQNVMLNDNYTLISWYKSTNSTN